MATLGPYFIIVKTKSREHVFRHIMTGNIMITRDLIMLLSFIVVMHSVFILDLKKTTQNPCVAFIDEYGRTKHGDEVVNQRGVDGVA